MGSSPHTRGARAARWMAATWTGIIPAYAGSTISAAPEVILPRDHPRIRGEHHVVDIVGALHSGSSPHTRGARQRSPARRTRSRIIPAYAGSTSFVHTDGILKPDHPRIRGEHFDRSVWAVRAAGSSPHTRGALSLPRVSRLSLRIIPAYAGSTARSSVHWASASDHPRIRGEHRLGESRVLNPCGIIPAYAGSTAPPPK